MKKPALTFLALGLMVCNGCIAAPLLIATGAVAGYAVSKDSVILDLDRSWDQVWRAALEETRASGRVKREDPKKGRLDARVQDTDVVVVLKQLNPSTVRVIVRARKNLLPKIQVAQQLGLGILRRAEKAGRLF